MAAAASGHPQRFLTLTVNPRQGGSPADRLRMLSNAWRLVRKRLQRQHPGEEVEFLAVVEATKAGEPHLHILARSPFVPQRWLSEVMRELTNAPIVDIRRVRSQREVVNYVAKYIGKQPAQFAGSKRYWSSRAWELPREEHDAREAPPAGKWELVKASAVRLIAEWTYEGFIVRRDKPEAWIAFPLSAFPDSPVWEYRRGPPRCLTGSGVPP